MKDIISESEFGKDIKNTLALFKPCFGACLPMNVFLYCALEKNFPQHTFRLKTGDLLYNGKVLFKQDFDLNQFKNRQNDIWGTWKGHAWLEIDEKYIVDISIFRTIYSNNFTLPIKQDMIQTFGKGRGALIINKSQNPTLFQYNEKATLTNEIINGVLHGIDQNKEMFLNI